MMKTHAFWVLLQWIVVVNVVQAQAVYQAGDLSFLGRYVTNVRLIGQSRQETGVLFAVTDSTLVLAPIKKLKSTLQAVVNKRAGTLPPIDSLRYFLPLRTYKYKQVSRLVLRRRGHGLKGMLIGIGIGAIVGAIQGDDTRGIIRLSAGDKAVAFGVIGALGGLISGVVGVKSVNAKEQAVATEMQGRLREYAIVEQLKAANLYTL